MSHGIERIRYAIDPEALGDITAAEFGRRAQAALEARYPGARVEIRIGADAFPIRLHLEGGSDPHHVVKQVARFVNDLFAAACEGG